MLILHAKGIYLFLHVRRICLYSHILKCFIHLLILAKKNIYLYMLNEFMHANSYMLKDLTNVT